VFWADVDEVSERRTEAYYKSGPDAEPVLTDLFHQLTLVTADGRTHPLDVSYRRDAEAVADVIQQRLVPYLLPRARKAVRAGDEVAFGPLRVLPTGLATGGGPLGGESELPWREVARIELTNGHLVVTARGGAVWFQAAYGDVPNARVLLALLADFAGAPADLRAGGGYGDSRYSVLGSAAPLRTASPRW
jgi:hypothetical protein